MTSTRTLPAGPCPPADAAKGPDGEACDLWTLDYTMIRATDRSWQIDRADPYHGVTHTRC